MDEFIKELLLLMADAEDYAEYVDVESLAYLLKEHHGINFDSYNLNKYPKPYVEPLSGNEVILHTMYAKAVERQLEIPTFFARLNSEDI